MTPTMKRRVVLLGSVGILGSILIRGLAAPAAANNQTSWLATANYVNADATTTVAIPAQEVPGYVGVDPNNIDLTTGLQIGIPVQVSSPVPSP